MTHSRISLACRRSTYLREHLPAAIIQYLLRHKCKEFESSYNRTHFGHANIVPKPSGKRGRAYSGRYKAYPGIPAGKVNKRQR